MNKSEKDFHVADHTAQAQHCAEMGKVFSKAASCHSEMAKASEVTDPQASRNHAQVAECYKTAAASCVAEGRRHVGAAEKIQQMDPEEGPQGGIDRGDSGLKASLDELSRKLDKLTVPDRVSAIPLDNNPLRVVPRPGAPTEADRKEAELHKSRVAPRVSEIIGTSDDSQARG